ncbi:xyloglucan endotransglucosylase/hydrolase protein 3-like [Salvia miltiorrhiza]|uniref:xyloglucan endotransglucosylase/hydrolase protein 3-like n=1 Tax=Salvia miltiorrhiza TaxID=226208 RepID=UPI0025AC7199|nr:xyloglucan endotransglucosylase/hydrolase protein 3-like [Salvia miltiorrhiza]
MQADGLNNPFSAYYSYLWGGDHFSLNPQGTEVQLKMDRSSGAGFRSKLEYGSGLFHMRMKIPEKKTGGIVTTFYLTAAADNQDPGNHFEIDYEFLGTNGTVQTNVYDNDTGHREQSFNLWFDPSKDYHSYDFLWNCHQIVFLIDNIPIRVFKNNVKRGAYPNKAMHIEASIWNADASWVGPVEWEKAPFIASYSDFGFHACPAHSNDCDSPHYSWNGPNYTHLNTQQKAQMVSYRRKYMSYDYCAQQSTRKPECDFEV